MKIAIFPFPLAGNSITVIFGAFWGATRILTRLSRMPFRRNKIFDKLLRNRKQKSGHAIYGAAALNALLVARNEISAPVAAFKVFADTLIALTGARTTSSENAKREWRQKLKRREENFAKEFEKFL